MAYGFSIHRSSYWIFVFFLCVLIITLFYNRFPNDKNSVVPGVTVVSEAKSHSCETRFGKTLNTQLRVFNARDIENPYSVTGIILGRGTYNLSDPRGTKNKMTWSQYGQDRYLDEKFQQKRNGFFVEIGGYDGESFSNTLFLEKERDWSGVLIEASPLMSKFMFGKDRKCYMINACISSTVSCMSFILAGAITSAKETLTNRHKARIKQEEKQYGGKHPHWGNSLETVDVRCYSLDSILKALNRTHVDYFSLDVEGAELFILKSIDWDKIDIEWFTIETDQHRDEILKFMKDHGYEWISHLVGDDIFKKHQAGSVIHL